MICPKCKATIADSKFCPECGAALKALTAIDPRTEIARPESRPVIREQPADRTMRRPTVEVVDAEYRVIEAIGEQIRVGKGEGLLVIYGDETQKEWLVQVSSEDKWFPRSGPQRPDSLWPGSTIASRGGDRYVWHQNFRMKEHRLGGFAVVGVTAVLPVGFYDVGFLRPNGATTPVPTLMVEAGEITECDFRRKR